MALLLLTGCGHIVLAGQARSMRYDPERVGGLPVDDTPSGPRALSPPAIGRVENTNNGDIDRLVLLALNDVEAFWKVEYPRVFGGSLRPVAVYLSVDPNDSSSPPVCGTDDLSFIAFNAAYCDDYNSINWDRSDGGLLAAGKEYFGSMAVVGILAHEFGHAVQFRAQLPEYRQFTLVKEQQADCFAGVYLRWVAAGSSTRFTLGTADGLNRLLAGQLALRDDRYIPGEEQMPPDQPHGTGLDRVSALQLGFEQGAHACAGIDISEIHTRRGDLPAALFDAMHPNSDAPIDSTTLSSLFDELQEIFNPAQAPTLKMGSASCDGGARTKFAAYCPSSNTVATDLDALRQIGTHTDEEIDKRLLQGDNTALSVVTSRYVMALEHQRGLALDSPQAAMRTACLTGFAQREMAQPVNLPTGQGLTLGAGDLDEAISGLLTNGVVASDVHGTVLPAGFTRVSAFQSGLLSNGADDCFQRF